MSLSGGAPILPASPSSEQLCRIVAPGRLDSTDRLDELLEIYLERLDTYQQLREKLSKNFVAGFLSLAHANRTSNLGSGRHYGEEGYDDRMKAERRVRIHVKDGEDTVISCRKDVESSKQEASYSEQGAILYSIDRYLPSEVDSYDSTRSTVHTEPTAESFDRFPGSTSAHLDSAASDLITSSSSSQANAISTPGRSSIQSPTPPKPNNKKLKKPVNPLNWYGLFVPPSLRAAQTSFTTSLEDQIPQLLNIQAEMADLEAQVRQLRRQLGLTDPDGHKADSSTQDPSQVDEEAEETQTSRGDNSQPDYPATEKNNTSPSLVKTTGRQRLSSRPKEPPRSRVLKLDS